MEYSSMIPQCSAPSSVSSMTSGSQDEGRGHARLRTVRLTRRLVGPLGTPATYGFSVRGGREHGTGFFVSAIEPGSDAQHQGLRVGDQIIRINGFPVEDAIHKEILQLVQSQNHLTLKVRTVGMIPVKDKRSDPLTWRVIDDPNPPPPLPHQTRTVLPTMETTTSCSINEPEDLVRDVRLILTIPPHSKLGCGICKGPDWHPGIFVQFTKENGLAREVGLRPGDQVLQCNGVLFRDISFSDAVHVLKSSRQLDLIIRKGAGLDLFPGESSGYNSSASSVNGDQSPQWEDTKRLSVVKEESLELEERLGQLETNHRSLTFDKEKEWDQIGCEWQKTEKKRERTPLSEKQNKMCQLASSRSSSVSPGTSCTIICIEEKDRKGDSSQPRESQSCRSRKNSKENVMTNGGVTECDPSSSKLAEICMISQQQETTTVIVEVHRSEKEDRDEDEKDRSLHTASESSPVFQRVTIDRNKDKNKEKRPVLVKSCSNSSFVSVASSSASSLSSAISQELQRRSQRTEEDKLREKERRKEIVLKTIDSEKRQQHDQLMEEFKKAHRKMFSNSSVTKSEESKETKLQTHSQDDRESSRVVVPKEKQETTIHIKTDGKIMEPVTVKPSGDTVKKALHVPPPPPLPPDETDASLFTARPAIVRQTSELSTTSGESVPPPCPTPDYDTTSIMSSNSSSVSLKSYANKSTVTLTNHNKTTVNETCENSGATTSDTSSERKMSDGVEMRSLESYRLNNPAAPTPKPPQTYFLSRNNVRSSDSSSTSSSSTDVTTRKARPVSVTIGEYPSGVERKVPTRFDFLQHGNSRGGSVSPVNSANQCQLQSELAQTLSRSNLRNRIEPEEKVNDTPSKTAKGTVTVSVNSVPGDKTSWSSTQHYANVSSTCQINNEIQQNGKLKLKGNENHLSSGLKPVMHYAPENIGSVITNNINNSINNNNNNNKLTLKVSNGLIPNENVHNIKQKDVHSSTRIIHNETTAPNNQPNGILKNGANIACLRSQHKSVLHQKSITFGEITTVISDMTSLEK